MAAVVTYAASMFDGQFQESPIHQYIREMAAKVNEHDSEALDRALETAMVADLGVLLTYTDDMESELGALRASSQITYSAKIELSDDVPRGVVRVINRWGRMLEYHLLSVP